MSEKRYYNYTAEEIIKEFEVDVSKGLSSEEAKKRLKKYGLNEIQEGKRSNFISKIFGPVQRFDDYNFNNSRIYFLGGVR